MPSSVSSRLVSIVATLVLGTTMYSLTRSESNSTALSSSRRSFVYLHDQVYNLPRPVSIVNVPIVNLATQSCEVCLVDPTSSLCYVSRKTIKSSQALTGSSTRVRRFLEKARRGENVRIGVIGASVTNGQGLLEGQKSFSHAFFEDFQRMYPKSELFIGAVPATNSEFFSFCFESVIPRDMDLYIIELDINNAPNQNFVSEDRLYRALLNLDSRPAIIRASVFALGFSDLSRGVAASLSVSQHFDVPVISLRAALLSHIILHPDSLSDFFHPSDLRHITKHSHQLLGDLISLYIREQVCEIKREILLKKASKVKEIDEMWPADDVYESIPRLSLWDAYSETQATVDIVPSCRYVDSPIFPLLPSLIDPPASWERHTWNKKAVWRSRTVGSQISFPVKGRSIVIQVWFTKGDKLTNPMDYPGRAKCWIEGVIGNDAHIDSYRDYSVSDFGYWSIADGLATLDHVVTCEILEASSTMGHDFRIMGVASL